MHLKLTFIVLCLYSITSLVQAQVDTTQPYRRNAIYFELGGNAFIYSLNFDYKFAKHVSGRIGASVAKYYSTYMLFPTMINYLVGSRNSRLELGAGLANWFSDNSYFMSGTATIGYRYQPLKGGFNFRIGFTPMIFRYGVRPWVGISLGHGF